MTHPNETKVRSAYDAASTGDLAPMLDLLHDDIQWQVAGESPLAGDYRGKQGILEFFGAMAELYDNTQRVQVADVLANDHRAVVLTDESAVLDGQTLNWTSAHVYTIDDGTVTAFSSYQDDAYHAIWSARRVPAWLNA
jgi:ketosteroid isomerase-like protein